MAWICRGLILTRGVQAAIWSHFGDLVSPCLAVKDDGFILVASFGRCKFKLSDHSVSLILQATLGGVVTDFRSKRISERVYQFLVASRNVSFHIAKIRSFSCDNYKLFFHLWGHGGGGELEDGIQIFIEEGDAQWHTVIHKQGKKSYADAVRTRSHRS
jgi:hypothetical protein